MRRASLLLAALLFCASGAALRAETLPDESALRDHLQARFRADRADDPDARYVAAFADLDRDGRAEAIVYLLSGSYCGSGGCNLLILTPRGRFWRQVADLTIVNPPVRLLRGASHGWRDLAVTVAGGGARAHEALIAFNGNSYPGNPSMPPARTLRRPAPGRVLIADGDRGVPLFR